MKVKVYQGKSLPGEYKLQINKLMNGLNSKGESMEECIKDFTDGRFVLGFLDNQIAGFVRVSGNDNFQCSIAYVARAKEFKGCGVAKELISYIQRYFPIPSLAAIISSSVPEKVDKLLKECGFNKRANVYLWER